MRYKITPKPEHRPKGYYFVLTAEQGEKIKAASKELDLSQSFIMRELVDRYLSKLTVENINPPI